MHLQHQTEFTPPNATPRRPFAALGAVAAAFLLLAGCTGQDLDSGDISVGPAAIEGLQPSGRVEMTQVQAAYIGSGSAGSGTLWYRGRSHSFSIGGLGGGLGVGGIGFSTIEANGEVYKLDELSQFPGGYAQGRYGFALGSTSMGDLWLQNEAGVILHLKAKRSGLMLSLGGDAVVIDMQK